MTARTALFIPAAPGTRIASYEWGSGFDLRTLLGWVLDPADMDEARGVPVALAADGFLYRLDPGVSVHIVGAGDGFDLEAWAAIEHARAESAIQSWASRLTADVERHGGVRFDRDDNPLKLAAARELVQAGTHSWQAAGTVLRRSAS